MQIELPNRLLQWPGDCEQLSKLAFRAALVSSACKGKTCRCGNTLNPQKTHNQSALHYHLVVVAWSGIAHISKSYWGEFSYHHQKGKGAAAAAGSTRGLVWSYRHRYRGIRPRKHWQNEQVEKRKLRSIWWYFSISSSNLRRTWISFARSWELLGKCSALFPPTDSNGSWDHFAR